MNEKQKELILDDRWLKATVLGSIWATFEIIVGSLLHNLRMPFAGTILSTFAVILLVSFYQLWRENGIILRAGMICAVMKSVSPSAVIFGPMIGIITEALVLEFIVMVSGKNLFSYIIGGSIAVFSALIHKAVNLILLYSFDLVNVYQNMVNFAERKLDLPESSGLSLIIILSLIYLIIGAISSIIGYIIGQNAVKITSKPLNLSISSVKSSTVIRENRFSIPLLVIHLIILILGLYLLSSHLQYQVKVSLLLLYTTFCFLYYKNIHRRLMKPLFWIQLVIILLLASIFLNYDQSTEFSFKFALMEGSVMLFRALFVITSFSSIGKELSNPLIRDLLVKKGFRKLYLAIRIAFEVLPHMIEQNASFKSFFKKPVTSLSILVVDADSWLRELKSKYQK